MYGVIAAIEGPTTDGLDDLRLEVSKNENYDLGDGRVVYDWRIATKRNALESREPGKTGRRYSVAVAQPLVWQSPQNDTLFRDVHAVNATARSR